MDFAFPPQSNFSAQFLMGHVTFITENFKCGTGKDWSATLVVKDGLGFNRDDGAWRYYTLGWLFPERRITRGKWDISGTSR